MNISRRLGIAQWLFVGFFIGLLAAETFLYVRFQALMTQNKTKEAKILNARSKVTSLSGQFLEAMVDPNNRSVSDIAEKAQFINDHLMTLLVFEDNATKNNDRRKPWLSKNEDIHQLIKRENEFFGQWKNATAFQLKNDLLPTLLHFDRAKRAISNDILGLASVEMNEAMNVIEDTVRWHYLALLVLAIAAVLAIVTGRRSLEKSVVAPLGELNECLRRLAKGEKVIRTTEDDSSTEIGDIIRNFDHMRDALNVSSLNLKEANKKLEEFASVAAHDLRSPIASIDGYLQLAMDSSHESESDRQTHILKARRIAARAMNMLESLLAYAKAAGATPKATFVSIEDTMRDVLEDLDSHMKNSSAKVTMHNLDHVYADPQMLYELLLNLIGNSIKYRQPGTAPEISVWQNVRTINGRVYDEICVTDNGIGFDMAEKDDLVKPFRRLSSAAGYEGAGLGLAVCAQIMRNHQGFLDYSSLIGVGSTFSALFSAREKVELTTTNLIPRPLTHTQSLLH